MDTRVGLKVGERDLPEASLQDSTYISSTERGCARPHTADAM